VNQDFFDENNVHFKSKAGSKYSYTEEGVYRFSNHWGRVADCRWRLLSDEKLKNQNYYLGFAKWTDFFALNETEKQFYISVDFENSSVEFHHKGANDNVFVFFAKTAQKKVAEIRKLLTDHKWANYFDEDIDVLREKVITAYITSNKTLQEIKSQFN
jgi:hypothetical protein